MSTPIQSSFGAGPNDSFVSVINTSGTSLLFSSYLGGDDDGPTGLASIPRETFIYRATPMGSLVHLEHFRS